MKKIILLVVGIILCSTTPILAKSKTLCLVGDATLAEYPIDSLGAQGWGVALKQYINKNITVINLADTCMSAKKFVDVDSVGIMKELSKNSFILIQFGANDLKEQNQAQYSSLEAFTRRLNKIICEAKKHKINVILCTPLAVPYYRDSVLVNRLGGYPETIRRVATFNKVALLDLEQASREWLQGMTKEEAAAYYLSLNPDQLVNDEYQLNAKGAEIIATMAKDAIMNAHDPKLKQIIGK